MKRLFFFLFLLIIGNAVKAQSGQASPLQEPAKTTKGGDQLTPSDSAQKNAETRDYQIIDGRKVKVDSQGIQSLEAVEPAPAVKPPKTDDVK